MAGPCIQNTNCIDLSIDVGNLRADLVISPAACNAAACSADGLYVAKPQSLIQAGVAPSSVGQILAPAVSGGGAADAPGWQANISVLANFPIGVPVTVVQSPLTTFTNESTCFSSNVMSVITGREIAYTGDATVKFEITHQADIDGAGFVTMFNYIGDYRDTATPAGGIQSSIPSGSSTSGKILAAGASFTYRYRMVVTNIINPGGGTSLITSPGINFCHLSMTN